MDKQGLVVIGLILLAWIGWQTQVRGPELKRYQEEYAAWEEGQRKKAEEEATRNGGAAPVDSAGVAAADTNGSAAPPPGVEQVVSTHPHVDGIAFETPEHALTLTTSGAAVETLTFKDVLDTTYVINTREVPDHDPARERQPLRILRPYGVEGVRSFAVEPLDPALAEFARGDWRHEALEGGGHRFSLLLPNGVQLTKTFTPPTQQPLVQGQVEGDRPRLFHFDVSVEVKNTRSEKVPFRYRLLGPAGMVDDSGDTRTAGVSAVLAARPEPTAKVEVETLMASEAEKVDGPDLTLGSGQAGAVTFFGLTTKYFAGVVIPQEAPVALAAGGGLVHSTGKLPAAAQGVDTPAHQALAWGEVAGADLAPGEVRTDRYMVYVGPKQKSVFEDEGPYHGYGLEKLIDFGWFEFMARILLAILGVFHAIVGNWGVAILLLTVLVRTLLLPLSMWSQKNMLRMQKLAPELNKLKEKYTRKDGTMTPEAQRQFSMEQMELMRKTGVNPVGCLGPIFLQFPVFIGLWNALNYSFDLRGQPFAFWIGDLSVPDVLARLPFSIPLLGTDAFSILPLIMIFTYWLQQAMQPPATDPRAAEQQKMMKMIIPFFGLLLYTAPSGLMLYFITSSFWSIVEQKWVKKRIEAAEGPIPGGVAAPMM